MFRQKFLRFPKRRIKIKVDRLSLLPNGILAEILSRLDSTKEVIRTSILSKRWKHICCEVPILVFDYHVEDEFRTFNFYESVLRILSQYKESFLKKLQLHSSFVDLEAVYSCIKYAVDLNVQELDINVWDYKKSFGLQLPDVIFNCSSFTDLKLSEVYFNNFKDVICWNNLRYLFIEYGTFDDNVFFNIISGSPVLEYLVLHYCSGFKVLDIIKDSVKNLVIASYSSSEKDVLKINAPYIQSLTIKGDFDVNSISLVNVSSVFRAELNFTNFKYHNPLQMQEHHQISEEMLKELIITLSHAKEIQIGPSSLEVLATLNSKGFINPSNLKLYEEIDSQ